MAAKNPVEYAESVLDVHGVWNEAQERLAAHEEAKNAYLAALTSIRWTENQIATREAEIVAEERGTHPDMKITEFKQHVATVQATDETTVDFRGVLADQKAIRDEAEQGMKHHDLGVRALTARMNELAGLLDFYAAAKEAQTARH